MPQGSTGADEHNVALQVKNLKRAKKQLESEKSKQLGLALALRFLYGSEPGNTARLSGCAGPFVDGSDYVCST